MPAVGDVFLDIFLSDLIIPYTPERDLDFFLVGMTLGLIKHYFPYSVNVYNCTQCPITISETNINNNWIGSPPVLTLEHHNRTLMPLYYYDLIKHFSTNDTVNCPILMDSLQIEYVVNAETG